MRAGRPPTKAELKKIKRSNFKPVAPLPHALLRIPSPIIMLKRSFTVRTIAPIQRELLIGEAGFEPSLEVLGFC